MSALALSRGESPRRPMNRADATAVLASVDIEFSRVQASRPSAAYPSATLRCLTRRRVDYVVIGGLAAAFYGFPELATDVDILPDRGRRNLERLSAAIWDLFLDRREALYAMSRDANSLEWNVPRDIGLDLMFHPDGVADYAEIRQRATIFTFEGRELAVAALEDIIESKKASARAKDRDAL